MKLVIDVNQLDEAAGGEHWLAQYRREKGVLPSQAEPDPEEEGPTQLALLLRTRKADDECTRVHKYDEAQPRDERGRWTASGVPSTSQEGLREAVYSQYGVTSGMGLDKLDEVLGRPRVEEMFDTIRAKEREWRTQMEKALSRGGITQQEATKHFGYYPTSYDSQRDWKELPKTLYHVTTAKDAVLQTGLKSRDELAMRDGAGLGGGASDTISFTDDPNIAHAILSGMYTVHDVMTGKTAPEDLVNLSKLGEGAPRPFFDMYMKLLGQSLGQTKKEAEAGGVPLTVAEGMKGYKVESLSFSDISSVHLPYGSEESKAAVLATQPPGTRYVADGYTIARPMTDEEKDDFNFTMARYYLAARENAGGAFDPLFVFNDAKAFKAIPREQIALLEATPKPGAHGYTLGSMAEYRTFTGDVIDRIRPVVSPIIKYDESQPRDENGRWIGTDADKYFHEKDLSRAANQSPKSRDRLVSMNPDDFLRVAEKVQGVYDPQKKHNVESALGSGAKLMDIPFLQFVNNGDGTATVTGHEGRHRAMAFRARGLTSMPVLLASGERGAGPAIRWGVQDDPTSRDRLRGKWPTILKGQNRDDTIPFPVADLRAKATQKAEFNEADHPRDEKGRFAESSKGKGSDGAHPLTENNRLAVVPVNYEPITVSSLAWPLRTDGPEEAPSKNTPPTHAEHTFTSSLPDDEVVSQMTANIPRYVSPADLFNVEKELRENAQRTKTEEAHLFTADGKSLRFAGTTGKVEFTKDQVAMMRGKGAFLTHSHPSGSSFSVDDLAFATYTGLKEIRAVGDRYLYRISGFDSPRFDAIRASINRGEEAAQVFFRSISSEGQRLRDHFERLYFDEKIKFQDIDLMASHARNKATAKALGLNYERIDLYA